MSGLERQDSAKQLSRTANAAEGKAPEGALAPRSRQTAERQAALAKAQQQATVVEKAFFPSLMAASVPVTKDIGASGFRLYLDKLLEDAGRPTDPIEVMMAGVAGTASVRRPFSFLIRPAKHPGNAADSLVANGALELLSLHLPR